MYKLISWFQINYPHLRDALKDSMHNFDDKDLNPYHLESDCWSHTMMVCKIAEIEGYDKVVQIAALLHDIGKPSVRRINPRNNHVQFFGHEIVSAYMSIDIMHQMIKENIVNKDEAVEIILLVALHSTFYKEKNIINLFNIFKNYKTLFTHLIELSKCDHIGRFCENSWYDYDREKTLKVLIIEMQDKPFSKKIYTLLDNTITLNDIDSIIAEEFLFTIIPKKRG